MSERRRSEIALLREGYPSVRHDDPIEWVIVEDTALPDGYNRSETEILIDLPAGYPQTPPDNFYVPAGLRLADGSQPDAFNPKHRTHVGEQWDRFSWHEDDGWSPAPTIENGSNLLTFMATVEERLGAVE